MSNRLPDIDVATWSPEEVGVFCECLDVVLPTWREIVDPGEEAKRLTRRALLSVFLLKKGHLIDVRSFLWGLRERAAAE